MTILVQLDAQSATALAGALHDHVEIADGLPAALALVGSGLHDLVALGSEVDPRDAFRLANDLRRSLPHVGVVMLSQVTSELLRDAMIAGVREVVPVGDTTALVEACHRSRQLSRELGGGASTAPTAAPRGRLLTVFSAKGGCGKTTMATNIACSAARSGKRVCLVDLDLSFGDVAITMQLQPLRTIADAVSLTALDATAVRSLVTRHPSGVEALLAPVEPGLAESISGAMVGELLDVLMGMYDVVVVDSPPAFTDHVLAAFDRSDWFVLLATLDVPALKNLKLTLQTMDVLGYPRDRLQLVLNRSDAKVGLSLHDVERALGSKITTQVPSSRAVPAAINRGVPILLDQPNHPVSTAIRRLADSMTSTVPAEAQPSSSTRRFSSRRRSGAHA